MVLLQDPVVFDDFEKKVQLDLFVKEESWHKMVWSSESKNYKTYKETFEVKRYVKEKLCQFIGLKKKLRAIKGH